MGRAAIAPLASSPAETEVQDSISGVQVPALLSSCVNGELLQADICQRCLFSSEIRQSVSAVCSNFRRDLDPHLRHDPFGSAEPTTKVASESFQPFFGTDDRKVSL